MTSRSAGLGRGLVVGAVLLGACRATPRQESPRATDSLATRPRLPTGARLDPAGTAYDVGQMPLAVAVAPAGDRVVLLLAGWREQGIQVVERTTGRVVQTVPQPAAFVGLAFAPDGRTLYVSGGGGDVIYRYAWQNGTASLTDSLLLEPKRPGALGRRYPAGVAPSPDGRVLYVAENLADSVAVLDLASGRVARRLPTERYPYGVVVAPDGTVYVSAWGGRTVSVFRPDASGLLAEAGRIAVARHPSAMVLNASGSRLFVASATTDRIDVVDTKTRRVLTELHDVPERMQGAPGPPEGSTPNALALSRDGTRLFVAEADNNAVAIFDLSESTAGAQTVRASDRLAGRVPVGWYPTAVAVLGDTLVVANAKGRGTAPNPENVQPGHGTHGTRPSSYTLGQLSGTLTIAPVATASGGELAALTARVERANGWRERDEEPRYPPIRHVVYIIKENRTYDQVFGDEPRGDGDTTLLYFPRAVTPNHHALADRFGLYDRFFVNAEVSPQGHNWSTAAYTTDYLEKTVPSQYAGSVIPSRGAERGRPYDYEGTNRGRVPAAEGEDDVSAPAAGYLWNLAQAKGITLRNYGEFTVAEAPRPEAPGREAPGREVRTTPRYRATKPFLAEHTDPAYPGWDLAIPDQRRADEWIAALQRDVQRGEMPALEIVRLPNDHTAGARAGMPTPRAMVADNDLALGRMIDALSRTPFWRESAVFVLEDDAQDGPDHVDSHRSVFLVASPWASGGVQHRFVNTTDVIATIEEILGLGTLSQFDHYGRPLREIWRTSPDTRPYTALTPSVPLTERNPATGRDARASARLDLRTEDAADEDAFNRILWRTIKGSAAPYPGTRRRPRGTAAVDR